MEFRKIKFNSKEDVKMQGEKKDGCLHDCAIYACKNEAEFKNAKLCYRFWNSKKTIWF